VKFNFPSEIQLHPSDYNTSFSYSRACSCNRIMKPAVPKGTSDSSHCLRRTASVPTKNASLNYTVINSVISCVFTVSPVVIFSSRFLISCYIELSCYSCCFPFQDDE